MLFGESQISKKGSISDYESNLKGIYDQMLIKEANRHYTEA